MKSLLQGIVLLASIAGAVVLNFAFWFHTASLDPDPTVGGAYAAVAMLSTPVAAIVGIAVGGFLASRIK